jgi:hypothetical protein
LTVTLPVAGTTFGTGSATCGNGCAMGMAALVGSNAMATTKACHSNGDCAGYMGTALGASSPWTSCCSLAAGPHFCVDRNLINFIGGTCPP